MTAPTATTARDLMNPGVECVQDTDSVADAARRMRALDVGCMPVAGPDGGLTGIITDRDIVVQCVAEGKDIATVTAGELAGGQPYHVDVNASKEEVLSVMGEHQVRRLPVVENGQLVGMISECDLVRGLGRDDVAAFCNAVYGV
ncbi:CBS domain-containing protein [Streptomyces sp. A7024]|uniref:CBS domain-containing protein n=1 Tax=Streptomyces coryli TaxID=1128680 RepID=A0A6G4TVV1_9ACTN|nr:CBS domain-containing protein [Streptomyces coryli]NGN64129.1 CBS domain-containing protein [Streptomyces coryli]